MDNEQKHTLAKALAKAKAQGVSKEVLRDVITETGIGVIRGARRLSTDTNLTQFEAVLDEVYGSATPFEERTRDLGDRIARQANFYPYDDNHFTTINAAAEPASTTMRTKAYYRVNWPSTGAQDTATARQFAQGIIDACDWVDRCEADDKNKPKAFTGKGKHGENLW